MTVCHMLLGRPWQYDKRALHNGHSNTYTFKWLDKTCVLQPMTPSQIIADNAKALARAQYAKTPCEKSGERENHTIVSESHKPNSCEKTKSVLLATKIEMREVRNNPSILHYVLICKGLAQGTNELTNVPPSLMTILQEFQDVFPEELPHGLPPSSWNRVSHRPHTRRTPSKPRHIPHEPGRDERDRTTNQPTH